MVVILTMYANHLNNILIQTFNITLGTVYSSYTSVITYKNRLGTRQFANKSTLQTKLNDLKDHICRNENKLCIGQLDSK